MGGGGGSPGVRLQQRPGYCLRCGWSSPREAGPSQCIFHCQRGSTVQAKDTEQAKTTQPKKEYSKAKFRQWSSGLGGERALFPGFLGRGTRFFLRIFTREFLLAPPQFPGACPSGGTFSLISLRVIIDSSRVMPRDACGRECPSCALQLKMNEDHLALVLIGGCAPQGLNTPWHSRRAGHASSWRTVTKLPPTPPTCWPLQV